MQLQPGEEMRRGGLSKLKGCIVSRPPSLSGWTTLPLWVYHQRLSGQTILLALLCFITWKLFKLCALRVLYSLF